MKKKTSTGRAERINQNGAAKCGGAVARPQKRLLAASSENTKQKMTRKKATRTKKNWKKRWQR